MQDVYAGKKEMALDSQLYFLTSRIKQLAPEKLAKGQIYISDYVFDKELIYARQLLDEQQLDMYELLYQPVTAKVTEPVLVIYMQDSAKNCLERIHERNRPYEQRIVLKFLKALKADYDQLFTNWKKSPVIRITASEFNCERDEDIEYLTNKIKHYTATL
jgi:deoxyadenosine/deoxycytidine kinase